jgi:peptide/nickel transport system permease protein
MPPQILSWPLSIRVFVGGSKVLELAKGNPGMPVSAGEGRAGRRLWRTAGDGAGSGWAWRIALVVLILLVLASLLAPLFAPYSPMATDVFDRLGGPSGKHLLGTDSTGRDVLSRTLYGGRSAFEGVGIALLGTVILGVPWGLLAGWGGRAVDETLMRLADAVMSFPALVLAVSITAVLGPSLVNSMVAISVVFAPIVARLLRSSVLPLRDAEFIQVARSLRVSKLRIALRHVLPNAMGPVLVQLFSLASLSLIIEAALAFLGLGVQPPSPSWGADLAEAYSYFTAAPLGTVVLGLTITIAALSISVVGDRVRAVLG